jgi:hypothetical protein
MCTVPINLRSRLADPVNILIRRTGVLVFGPRGCDEIEDIKRNLSVNGVPYQVFPGNEVGMIQWSSAHTNMITYNNNMHTR